MIEWQQTDAYEKLPPQLAAVPQLRSRFDAQPRARRWAINELIKGLHMWLLS